MANNKLSSSRVSAADYDEAFEYLYTAGMTDGLPVVPPTLDRVHRMVEASGRDSDESVGDMAPAMAEATIEKIAINAVMAGCLPEYMPVIIAAVEAMVEEPFNLHGIQSTTNPVAVALIVNGPVRNRLLINYQSGCFGPGWRANATIGRAIRLIQLNIGGAVPDSVDKSTQGMPGKYTFCFGENEEESPWDPLHVERGFDAEQSCVTVVPPQSTVNFILPDNNIEQRLPLMAEGMNDPATNHYNGAFRTGRFSGEPLVVFNPVAAKHLAEAGFGKNDLKRYFHAQCRYPIDQFFPDGRMPEVMDNVVDGMVLMAARWQDYMIVVAGGHGGLHSTYMPTFAHPHAITKLIRE